MPVKLGHVSVVVSDMEAMAGFYRRLGVPINDGPSEWAPHHRNTGTDLEVPIDLDSHQFASVWNKGWAGGPGIVLVFRTESRADVDVLYDHMTAGGYPGQQSPYDASWGARFAVVADPEGNSVGIMSEVDPDQRSAMTPPG